MAGGFPVDTEKKNTQKMEVYETLFVARQEPEREWTS